MTTDLIKRLTEATEGSRELDFAVREAMGFSDAGEPPHYTTSLDAAMTLVPEGCGVDRLGFHHIAQGAACDGFCKLVTLAGPFQFIARARTLPLALSAAALKAKDQS